MPDINAGKYNIIKVAGKKIDTTQIKGGIKINENMSEKEQTIFRALDGSLTKGDNKIGAQDNVLDKEEITAIINYLKETAGSNRKLGKREFQSLVNQLGLAQKGITADDLAAFFENTIAQSEGIADSEVKIDANGIRTVETKREDGAVETRYADGSYSVKAENKTQKFTADGKLESETVPADGGSVTTVYDTETKKPIKKIIAKGTTEEVYDYTSETETRLTKIIENKGLEAKEKTTEFEYDRSGNVIAKNITAHSSEFGTTFNRYELNEETGTLLPKQEIINKGSADETVTNFECQMGGITMESTTETPEGPLKIAYDITDETDENGVSILKKKAEILTTQNGYKEVKYNEDNIVFTTVDGTTRREETQYKDGRNVINVKNEDGAVSQEIKPDGTKIISSTDKSGVKSVQQFDASGKLVVRQDTDADGNVTSVRYEEDGVTIRRWDADGNMQETISDASGENIISTRTVPGKKARIEARTNEIMAKYGHLGIDAASVRKYAANPKTMTVNVAQGKGESLGQRKLEYEDPAHPGQKKVYTYEAFANCTAHPKFDAQGEVIGVTYEMKKVPMKGQIVGMVTDTPHTALVAVKGTLVYVDTNDGSIREIKRVRGDRAFNGARAGDKIDADVVNTDFHGLALWGGNELVLLRDHKGKLVKTQDGHQIAVDRYGNTHIIRNDAEIVSNLPYAYNSGSSDGSPKIVAVFAEGERGQEIYRTFNTAEAIINNPEVAKIVTEEALAGMDAELDLAESNLNRYMDGDGASWDHAAMDWLSDVFGSDNSKSEVEKRIKAKRDGIAKLRKYTPGTAEFATKYKEVFGVEYNPKTLASFYANANSDSRSATFGNIDMISEVRDYVKSQYSAVDNAKMGVVTGASIAAAVVSGALLTPALVAGGASLTWSSGHNLTTGEEVRFFEEVIKDEDGNPILDENGNEQTRYGGWCKSFTDAVLEGGMFYGAGKGYQIIEKGLAKGVSERFMITSGKRMLAETERKLGSQIVKNADITLNNLTKKGVANLSTAERQTFELLTKRQAILAAQNTPSIETLNALVKQGIMTDEVLTQSVKAIPAEMLAKTVAFDAATGTAMEFATTGDVTLEGAASYAAMSLLFQTVPMGVGAASRWAKGKFRKPELPVDATAVSPTLEQVTNRGMTPSGGRLSEPKINRIHSEIDAAFAGGHVTPQDAARMHRQGRLVQRTVREQGRDIQRHVADESGFYTIGKKRYSYTEGSGAVIDRINADVAKKSESILKSETGALAPSDAALLEDHLINNLKTPDEIRQFMSDLKNRVGVDANGNMHKYQIEGIDHGARIMEAAQKRLDSMASFSEITSDLAHAIETGKGISNAKRINSFIENGSIEELTQISTQLSKVKKSDASKALKRKVDARIEELKNEVVPVKPAEPTLVEPKPEIKPEPKPEVKPEPKPEVKPEPKPEVKPEPKPEVKPEPKPEVKPEPKPEVKPEPIPEVKPEPKPEVKPEPKPEIKPEPIPEVKPEPKPVIDNNVEVVIAQNHLPEGFRKVTTPEEAQSIYDDIVKSAIGDSDAYLDSKASMYDDKNWIRSWITHHHETKWKMHIYADSPQEWADAAQLSIPYLREHKVEFKTVRNLDEHIEKLRTANGGTQKGKAFTIYFKNEEEFLTVAQDLEKIFNESGLKSSGRVVGEGQIGNSGFLSYRNSLGERGTLAPKGMVDPWAQHVSTRKPEPRPAEPKPVEPKPEEPKPTEPKPAELKPVDSDVPIYEYRFNNNSNAKLVEYSYTTTKGKTFKFMAPEGIDPKKLNFIQKFDLKRRNLCASIPKFSKYSDKTQKNFTKLLFGPDKERNNRLISLLRSATDENKLNKIISDANLLEKRLKDIQDLETYFKSKDFYHLEGLLDIKATQPEKFNRIASSGIFDLIKEGKLNSICLNKLGVNADLSPEMYKDLTLLKSGKSIVPEFPKGTDLKVAFEQSTVGDAIEVGGKMYINDGKGLVEWSMTKEKYLELFPPVERFATTQGCLADCYLVQTMGLGMRNPNARVKFLQSFTQKGDDIIVTIKGLEDYHGSETFANSVVKLPKGGKHIIGCKGMQMYEQTYARVALRESTIVDYPSIAAVDNVMERAAWGHAVQAMGDVFGQGSIMDLVTFKVRKNNRMVNSNSYSSLSLRDSIPYRNPKTGQIFMYPLSSTDGRGKMFLLDKYFSDFSDKALAIRDVDIESTEFILKQYANDQNYIFAFGTKPKPASAAESALLPEYNLVSSHAYSILGYNESTKMVKIGNPHAYAEVTEIPIEKLHPYINHIEFLKI